MQKTKISKEILFLAITTLVTVLTWTGFQIYWAFNQNTIPAATKKQMDAFPLEIRVETIDSLKNNLTFTEEELNAINISEEPTITSTTESANLE